MATTRYNEAGERLKVLGMSVLQILEQVRTHLLSHEVGIDAAKSKLKAIVPTPKYVPSQCVVVTSISDSA